MSDLGLWICVIALILGGGLLALIPLFSDTPSLWISAAEAGVIFFGTGFLIGFIRPRRWWIAAFAAWPGVLMLIGATLSERGFRDAPVLTVMLSEGAVEVIPTVLPSPKVRLVQRNRGDLIHEIALARVRNAEELDQVRAGRAPAGLRWGYSFRPLAAGEESTADLGAGVLRPGFYAIGCRRATDGGIPHLELGEIALVEVERGRE